MQVLLRVYLYSSTHDDNLYTTPYVVSFFSLFKHTLSDSLAWLHLRVEQLRCDAEFRDRTLTCSVSAGSY